MGEDDDRRLVAELLQISLQPRELRVADDRARVRDVVEDDEVHALVVEGVVQLAEELLEGLAVVERGVVLAGQIPHGLHLEPAGDVLEALHALLPLFGVVGRVREVAGEDDEVRLLLEAVDGGDGFLERALGVGIHGRSLEPPMGVRELNEVEFLRLLHRFLPGGAELRDAVVVGGVRSHPKARNEHDAAEPCELHEVAPV